MLAGYVLNEVVLLIRGHSKILATNHVLFTRMQTDISKIQEALSVEEEQENEKIINPMGFKQ